MTGCGEGGALSLPDRWKHNRSGRLTGGTARFMFSSSICRSLKTLTNLYVHCHIRNLNIGELIFFTFLDFKIVKSHALKLVELLVIKND